MTEKMMPNPSRRYHRGLALAVLASLLVAALAPVAESRVIGADEGDRGELPNGFSAIHKVGELSTGSSQVFVAVGTIPPGMSTGRHLHEVDEEILYILEGELTLTLGDESVTAGPGETAFVPAGTWMELANRSSSTARALLIIPRAEAERCFRLIHGVKVEEMTESEKKEAHALCKLRVPAPPTEEGD